MIRWLLLAMVLPVAAWAQDIRQIEQNLNTIGYSPGVVDGIVDATTQKAVRTFQAAQGFDATGTLTAFEANHLATIARNAQLREPFIADSIAEQETTGLQGGRRLYANGLHYAAVVNYRIYNSSNVGRKAGEFLERINSEGDRRRKLMKASRVLAEQTQSALGLAVLDMTTNERAKDELQQTTSALRILLSAAEAQPAEQGLTGQVMGVVRYRIPTYTLCDEPDSDELRKLVLRSLSLPLVQNQNVEERMNLLRSVLPCVAQGQTDAVHQQIVAHAEAVSTNALYSSYLSWGSDALARGNKELARQTYRRAAEIFLADPVKATSQGSVFDAIFPHKYVLEFVELGMLLEVAKFNAINLHVLETIDVVKSGGSHIFEISHIGLITDTSRQLIAVRDFDGIKRLGRHLGANDTNFGTFQEKPDTSRFTQQDRLWEGAMVGLRSTYGLQVAEYAALILPQMLQDGAMAQALDANLMSARAAIDVGAFEIAEPALLRTISIARSIGAYDLVEQEIKAIRRALNLSKLTELSPAERLLEQMNIYYADACQSLETAKQSSYEFFDVDYEALGDDPTVAEALRASDAMNKLLGCHFPQRLGEAEARLICATAGFSGRKDVSDFILRGTWEGLEVWAKGGIHEQCAYGLVDAGRFDWITLQAVPKPDEHTSNNLWFITQPPARRKQLVAEADLEVLEALSYLEQIGMQYMEKEADEFTRAKIAKSFQRDFSSSFGRIGPSPQQERAITNNAIAYQRLGYFGTAEILFANDQRVDPFAFGQESTADLDADLLNPQNILLRARYAKLYREWGRLDKAYGAIGPLAERAVARLSSTDAPLPGTVEQWAKRLERLFIAYLELQFEETGRQPNYPAIFAIQQFLHLADSTASASVLEQRLNSARPDVARAYQDTQRALRQVINNPGDTSVDVSDLTLRLQSLEAQLPSSDAALKSHQIGVTRGLRDVILDLRAADAAMVVTTQLPNALVVMYLDGKTASARKLDMTREATATTVANFRRSILDSTEDQDLFDNTAALLLYRNLIGWGHPDKPPPKSLRLVTDGTLSTLPYAALRHEGGWLGATMNLRLSPSVARAASQLRKSETASGFIGLGDPNLTQGDVSARAALLGNAAYLAELPETAAELAFMALAFGGNPTDDVFTRDRATEVQLQDLNAADRLSDLSVLALATHGLLSRETGTLKSAGLMLSLPEGSSQDGILTAAEIYGYRIGADLVVLSACNTGTPGAGAGLSDLASAFLYSGAGALLLTHWEIDSGAGVELMKRIALDQRTNPTSDYPTSLQYALAGLLGDASLSKFHHPRFWASHFVLG